MRNIEAHLSPPSIESERFHPDRIELMISDLEARELIQTDKRFCVVVMDGTDPSSDLARSVEYGRFKETFANSYDLMENEYARFDPQSVFVSVIDVEKRQPAGVVRLIKNGPEGLKTLKDVANPNGAWKADMLQGMAAALESAGTNLADIHPNSILDVATMARASTYDDDSPNDKIISAALYRSAFKYAADGHTQYKTFITIMDLAPYEEMKQTYNDPYPAIDGIEPGSYLDSSKSLPCYCHVPSYLDRIGSNEIFSDFIKTGGILKHFVEFDR